MSASTSAHASPSLPLMLSIPIIFCSTRWIHPPEGRSLLPLTCFYRFYFFTVLFKLLSTTAEQQIPYGEHTQLLLQLMVLQSFKEGMVLGMPSKVLDYGSIFPVMESFMLNFLIVSITSTHSISYQTRPSGPHLMGSLRLVAQAHGEALQWVGIWVGLSFELRKCYLRNVAAEVCGPGRWSH